MKFAYELVPSMNTGAYNLQPRVPITFTNPNNGKSISVKALVDSGATISFLNLRLAKFLELDLTPESQGGVFSANQAAVAYFHDLSVKVKKDTHEFLMPCGFMDLSTDAVVGQTGFFEHYKIVFERYNKTFELTYVE